MKAMARFVVTLGLAAGLAGCSEPENEVVSNTDPSGSKTIGVNPPGEQSSEGARDRQLSSDPMKDAGAKYKTAQ